MLLYLRYVYMLMRIFLFQLIMCVICRVEQAHGNLKRILQTSMGDLCICWDAINNLLVLQHNVILVCLSLQQNVTIFSLRSKPPIDVSQHRIICIGHVYRNHFVQVNFIILPNPLL